MPKNKRDALLKYFTELGHSDDLDLTLDTAKVDQLIWDGADVNCRDSYGQTVLHEVARQWHIDVGKFLLRLGAAIDLADNYGRTPLHVAAASDYPLMVQLLIESGADKEAKSKGELHTPVFFAARNDACQSLAMLIKLGCQYQDIQDHRGRTPLHVAAELDRILASRFLMERHASVLTTDDTGHRVITWIIAKMPQIAVESLNQFRILDNQNRKQYYKLQYLAPGEQRETHSTPLHVAVHYRQFHVITHSSMAKLLDVMWNRFGLVGVWVDFVVNLVYILLWTLQGVLVEYDQRHVYVLPQQWWRVVLFFSAVGFTGWQIVEEFLEFYRSRKANKLWSEWRTKQIEKDKEFCHPRWPDEREFLDRELQDLNKHSASYFQDRWNIFDWICYSLLLVAITTHLADVVRHSESLARWHIRIMCVVIILLWLRLMKSARAFTLVGPFIVMLGHMMTDMLRFLFLYLEFYIPYVCAFWMIYGGDKTSEDGQTVVEVDGYQSFPIVFFSLFQLTMVDEYDFDNMLEVDSVMTYILLSTWFALSAILCVNLFIALLTNTFQTVYDNAKDNAMMQKAIIVLTMWDGMSTKRQEKFLQHIKDHCSPLVEYYDDSVTRGGEDLKKVTLQIRTQLQTLQENWKEKFGESEPSNMVDMGVTMLPPGRVVTSDLFERELYPLKVMIEGMKQTQEKLLVTCSKELKRLRHLLDHQKQGGRDDDTDGDGKPGATQMDVESDNETDMKMKKKKRKKHKKLKSVGLLNQDLEQPSPQIDTWMDEQTDTQTSHGLTRAGSHSKLTKRATRSLQTALIDVTDSP